MDLKETNILGDKIDRHWYYRSKARAVSRILERTQFSSILDVGAGSGFFSKYLLAKTSAQRAWCVDISYSGEHDDTEAGKPLFFRRQISSVDADLVLLMDVLEHVEDDVGLLREYIGKASRGSYFLISVPAFQWLWSEHDVFLEHWRRYTLVQIEDVARKSGLTVENGCYCFGSVFPIAAALRLPGKLSGKQIREARSQMTTHHPFINKTLSSLCSLELPLVRSNRLFGLSAFCLARST